VAMVITCSSSRSRKIPCMVGCKMYATGRIPYRSWDVLNAILNDMKNMTKTPHRERKQSNTHIGPQRETQSNTHIGPQE
jgi:hypothetical protein